ncbi:hypothetical protein G6F22_019573 [Rhizopus arrhizus]|nr:hypothetical protein G6F22_019573 [Rhizopus arrhizus]
MPASAQVLGALQAPKGIRQAAVEQAAVAALPRHARHGHAGVHDAVQVHAVSLIGGQRRQRQPQAACHRGGTECDSHNLLPMAAGVAARRSMHRLIASRSGVPRCP